GDVRDDGAWDLADAIAVLDYLFASGPAPGCLDAADCDDDGQVTIGDPVGLLNFLFAGGDSLVAPLGCGIDCAGDDGLGCDRYDSCGS
ncbi:MAG: hypothetical protein JXP34_08590, partial [Planctomycetes bacterium]|nr:hypothetical protein [Planctomycetota bacterium]